jgi:deferrochelatase/peroxidase EfeB
MTTLDSEFGDIQGLLWSGYGSLTEACFLLLQVTDPGAARAWLGSMVQSVTTVEQLRKGRVVRALHIALTAEGMRALGVADTVVDGFSSEFVAGMSGDEGRSRRLGDLGDSAPSRWRWGGAQVPDILVMLYAENGVEAWCRQIEAEVRGALTVLDRLDTSDMGGEEPFGFADGISQPRVDWRGERDPGKTADSDYGNLLMAGEFLLGYRNEYGLYTERPLLDAAASGTAILPAALDNPERRDLGRNGSYLVLRELAQDVCGFWRFIAAQIDGEAAQVALAEAMVGRKMSGAALLPKSARPIRGVGPAEPDIARNQFTYDEDKGGFRCPLGAHVRRANPRTGDMPGGQRGWVARVMRMLGFGHQDLSEDLIASSRFHRIIRRGREFGATLERQAALRPDVSDPHGGLYFICLNANISRQFEFIQNAWLMSAKFSGLSGEADPLLGSREPIPVGHSTDAFAVLQSNGINQRFAGLPRFITVRGGAYFFLPGVRALRYVADSTVT